MCPIGKHNSETPYTTGIYQKVRAANYSYIFAKNDAHKDLLDYSFGRPLFQYLRRGEGRKEFVETRLFLQYRMDIAMELSQTFATSSTNGAWVFYNLDVDSGVSYYNIALTVDQVTLSPLDITKDIRVYANDGPAASWIECPGGRGRGPVFQFFDTSDNE